MLWSGQGSSTVPSLARKATLDDLLVPKAESCDAAKEWPQLGLSFLV